MYCPECKKTVNTIEQCSGAGFIPYGNRFVYEGHDYLACEFCGTQVEPEPEETPISYKYDIDHAGEAAAGISSFTDAITITVESGDPGGDETGDDSFQEFMLAALIEWYDGAKVTRRSSLG